MLFPTPNISTSDSNIYIAYLANNIPLKQTKGILYANFKLARLNA